MQALDGNRHHGANLFGAKCHHYVNLTKVNLIERFGSLVGNVDANFSHGLDRKRIQDGRLGASALYTRCIAEYLTHQAFRHLATRRVCDAKK